ncbi:F0F1 ATP synthase subunit A [Croceicoccus estronivorus]|uniref:F0F1 ATP synthase subunit A n=1 Tax=Croceicoccus estronivorus TaxID=1172626 RepID=UPI00082E10C0|nr:F0F1 ATP synthase subunit A [Croceicoccus estronivorus]OCC25036.1 F0F1 ATP synthase subunit A [Croceicoccus estronivorus]
MTRSPLILEPLFMIGPVPITRPVVTTWAIMAVLTLFGLLLRAHLANRPGKLQSAAELVTEAIDHQISEVLQRDPAPYRALVGTVFLFILVANWSSLMPGTEPPTATLETDAALALIVLASTIWFGIRVQGVAGYFATFAQPSWAMIPLNLLEQITRAFSMIVRLFGNIMSGVFVVGIVLSLAGLLVPIPLMALDLLTGAVQAYIFAILSCVFIGAAVNGENDPPQDEHRKWDTT